MNAFVYAALALLMTAATATAQERSQFLTRPTLPPREALDRLNLKQLWSTVIPLDGDRDGIAYAQVAASQIFVQTRSGLIAVIDAATGQTVWRARAGKPFQSDLKLAYNRKSVFIINSTFLYALDRETGRQQWEYSLTEGIGIPPVADDDLIFLGGTSGRLAALILPRTDEELTAQSDVATGRNAPPTDDRLVVPLNKKIDSTAAALSSIGGTKTALQEDKRLGSGPQPVEFWSSRTNVRLELAPVLTRTALLVPGAGGRLVGYQTVPPNATPREFYRYRLGEADNLAPVGQYENIAYIGGHNVDVAAVDIVSGRNLWRYTPGAPVSRRPVAFEKEVYIAAEKAGLARVDAATGEPLWRVPQGRQVLTVNPEADIFLAVNPKFVYAFDPVGKFLVLDRVRGTKLTSYEGFRDFVFPIVNNVSDRVFLAAHNGLLVCLADRDYPKPYLHRKSDQQALDPNLLALEAKLAKLVSNPGSEPTRLEVMLKTLEKEHGIKFVLLVKDFEAAGIQAIEGRLVSHPKVEKRKLSFVLTRILNQAEADYRIVNDEVLIYPRIARN